MSEKMLAAVNKSRFGLEDILAPDSQVFFENIFSTRHIGRILDFMLFQCQRFIGSMKDPGQFEYRFRHALELAIFNGWSNYRKGEKNRCIEIEFGWDVEKIAMSVTFIAEQGVAGFVPGSGKPVNETSARMLKMLTQVQMLADGMVVRHEPDSGRTQIIAFISADGAQKLQTSQYIDVSKIPQEPVALAQKKNVPLELSESKLSEFLDDENVHSGSAESGAGTSEVGSDTSPGGDSSAGSDSVAGLVSVSGVLSDPQNQDKISVSGGSEVEAIQEVVGGATSEANAERIVRGSEEDGLESVTLGASATEEVSAVKVTGGAEEDSEQVVRGIDENNPEVLTKVKGLGNDPEFISKVVASGVDPEVVTKLQAGEVDPELVTKLKTAGLEKEMITKFGGDGVKDLVDGTVTRFTTEKTAGGSKSVVRVEGSSKDLPSEKDSITVISSGKSSSSKREVMAVKSGTGLSSNEGVLLGKREEQIFDYIQSLKNEILGLRRKVNGSPQVAEHEGPESKIEEITRIKATSDPASSEASSANMPQASSRQREEIKNLNEQVDKLTKDLDDAREVIIEGDEPAASSDGTPLPEGTTKREQFLKEQVRSLSEQIESLKAEKSKETVIHVQEKAQENSQTPSVESSPDSSGLVQSLNEQIEALKKERDEARDVLLKGDELAEPVSGEPIPEGTTKKEQYLKDQVKQLNEQIAQYKADKAVSRGRDRAGIAEDQSDRKSDSGVDDEKLLELNGELEKLKRENERLSDMVLSTDLDGDSPAINAAPDEDGKIPSKKEALLKEKNRVLQDEIERLRKEQKALVDSSVASSSAETVELEKKLQETDSLDENTEQMLVQYKNQLDSGQGGDPKSIAKGMMEAFVKERSAFKERRKSIESILRKKEHEFKTKEVGLSEQVRVLELQLTQKQTALEKSKEAISNLSATIDKIKSTNTDAQDKIEISHKLVTTEKLLDKSREQIERYQKRAEDAQKKATEETTARSSLAVENTKMKKQIDDLQRKMGDLQMTVQKGNSAEVQNITEQRDKAQKQIEELKRQLKELQVKLAAASSTNKSSSAKDGAAAKGGASGGSETELKHKLEMANNLAKVSKDEAEKAKKRFDDLKASETKLKGDLTKLQVENDKLKAELKAAQLKAGTAAANQKPGAKK